MNNYFFNETYNNMKLIFIFLFLICCKPTFIEGFNDWVHENIDLIDSLIQSNLKSIYADQLT